jgi:uncharacterized protein
VKSAFLDIETSWEKNITVIGIYVSTEGVLAGREGLTQFVAPNINRDKLLETLDGVDRLYTYNGTGFDLPVIERWLGVNLAGQIPHRDLMYDCWKRKLKGGLKAVERTLGIHRDTEGVDGLQAMRLWAAHQRHSANSTEENGCCEELDLLLRYNKEDCVNLEELAYKIGVMIAPAKIPAL